MFIPKTVAHSFPQSIHYNRSKCDSEAFIICTYAVLILFGAKMQSNSLVEFVVFYGLLFFRCVAASEFRNKRALHSRKFIELDICYAHIYIYTVDIIVLLKKRSIERTLTTNVKKRQIVDWSEQNTIGRIECTALLFRQIPQEAFEFFAFL